MIKIFTAFSGYDSQCLALKYLGLKYDLVGWAEIDKYAIQAHNLLFPQYTDRNLGDISKIDWDNVTDFNLFTYSFPCTDISIAGKQQGFSENSNTRSSLLWECRKAIKTKRPKYLLMENVKALTNKKNLPLFQKWLTDYTGNYLIINHCKQLGNIVDDSDRTFKNPQRGRIYDPIGVAPTQVTVNNSLRPSYAINDRIRKLTPKESFRLMGVREKDIDKLLNSGISNTQLYKLAGNSIVVDVLMAIFNRMFINETKSGEQLVLI